MPHPTPTAAKSASPLPRGEGVGVGGRHPTRPGPEPGPPPIPLATREVPGQARDGISFHCFAPLLAALLLATPTHAQIIPTGTPAADILLSAALAEQRVFLTCTTLDKTNHQIALSFWQDDVAAAVSILSEQGVPAEAIAAFTTAALPEKLLPAPDTPFAEVREFCDDQDKWFMRWSRRDFAELGRTLPQAFE